MCQTKFGWGCALILLAGGLLCLGLPSATAQTTTPPPSGTTAPPPADDTDGGGTEAPSTAHPPAFMAELMQSTGLTQVEVDQMRTSGWGWGEIRIAARLAQQMAANSNGTLTFDAALAQVQAAQAAGEGFGQIAADNHLKVGTLVEHAKAGAPTQGTAPAGAQAEAGAAGTDDTETATSAHPPAYMTEVMQSTGLTQVEVDQMRANGWGWGDIRIAARLAQQMAANSNGTLTFDAALAQVQAAQAAGEGFGQIAADNHLKLGPLVNNQAQAGTAAQTKKLGFFARLARFLGLSRPADKPAGAGVDKPQAAARVEKMERPERPGQDVKLERPEKPERPARPQRPERPEAGPHRG